MSDPINDLGALAAVAEGEQAQHDSERQAPGWRPVEPDQATLEVSRVLTGNIYAGLAWGVGQVAGSSPSYPPELQEDAAYQLARVMTKYDGEPPPWLRAYWEEILLAVALGQTALLTLVHIRQAQAEAAERDERAQESATRSTE